MKKTRSIQFLCALLIGVIFMLVVFAGLMVYDRFSAAPPSLVLTTSSVEALYDGTPLTNYQYHLVGGALEPGHQIIPHFTGSQTNVGISLNTMTVQVLDENGRDVTDHYNITYHYGMLQVNHRGLLIDATTDFAQLSPSNGSYTLGSDRLELLDGHYAVVSVNSTINDLGVPTESIENVTIYDEDGNEVTFNYQIYTREQGEVILIPTGAGGGSISTSLMGNDSGDGDGPPSSEPMFSVLSDVSGKVYFRTRSCGDYLGNGWATAPTFPGLYDNTYAASYLTAFYFSQRGYSTHEMEIVSHIPDYPLPYYMAPGDGYEIQHNDTTNMGSIEESYTVPFYLYDASFLSGISSDDVFENAYRDFVYANYTSIDPETMDFMSQIIQKQGFSKQTPGNIHNVATYIQNAATYNLDYDRRLDKASNNAIAFLRQYKEGVCRHYATAATLLYRALGYPARFTVGAVAELTADTWTDVMPSQAHAWVEVYLDGIGWIQVEVTGAMEGSGGNSAGNPAKLNLTPMTVSKPYDGTPLSSDGRVTGLEMLERMGYTYRASISGSQTEVGVSESTIDAITIFDPQGKDVTDVFTITTNPGRIHVYLHEITFRTRNVTMFYTGQPIIDSPISSSGQLQKGHRIGNITFLSSPDVGKKSHRFEVQLLDEQGNDVTDQYLIHKEYGTLTITPVEITLQAESATKKYDGTPLTCSNYVIASGQLCDGHSFAAVEISGQQTQIGRCDNMIMRVSIVDSDGRDVTSNYCIILQPGVLKVTYS